MAPGGERTGTPAILHVTRSGWGGGGEAAVHLLAGEAVNRGWRTTIAYWRRDPPFDSPAEMVRLPSPGRARGWPSALWRLIRRERPDIVHVHGTAPGSIGAAVARAAGANRIVHSEESVHRESPMDARLARRLTSWIPDVNVVPSRAVRRSLVHDAGAPAGRVTLIRRGTPEALAGPSPTLPPTFLCVANLWPWKGHRVLLGAMARLGPEVRLSLAGAGPERERLMELAADLDLGGRVDLLGHVRDPWSAVPGAWAAVQPSYHEGMPNSVVEAMMRGVPVVASSVGGIPEIVEHGRVGLLVPPGDSRALAGALQRLVQDRALRDRLGAAGRALALRDLRLQDMLDRHFRVYERLLRA